MLDVNDLLCQVAHVKFENKWKPQIHAMKCANKLVSPRPNHHQFLELCLSQFDIGMVNNDIAKPKTNNSIFVGGIVLWFIPLLSKHTTSRTQFDKFIVNNNFLYFDLLFRYSTLGFIWIICSKLTYSTWCLFLVITLHVCNGKNLRLIPWNCFGGLFCIINYKII